jgi:hypothetical protein
MPEQPSSRVRTTAEPRQQVFISLSFDSPLLMDFITRAVFMMVVMVVGSHWWPGKFVSCDLIREMDR